MPGGSAGEGMGRALQARNIWAKTTKGTKEKMFLCLEQRGAARKYFSVSDLSAAGASENQVFISVWLHPPPAFAFLWGVLPVTGEAGKGEQGTLAACKASWR